MNNQPTLDDIMRQVEALLDSKLKDAASFRRFEPLDSVTDQFSPVTGASQQIGFFGTNKIAQPTTAVGSATFADSGATTVHTASTFDGYTLGQVVKALRNLGLLH